LLLALDLLRNPSLRLLLSLTSVSVYRVSTLGSDASVSFDYSVDLPRRVRRSPFPSGKKEQKKERKEQGRKVRRRGEW